MNRRLILLLVLVAALALGCAAADTAQALAARDAAKQALMEREAQLFHEADYRAAVAALRQNIEALRDGLCQVNTGLVDRALVEQRAHRRLEPRDGALRLSIDAPVQERPAAQAQVMLDLLAPRVAGLRFVSLTAGEGFELVAQSERCPDAVVLPAARKAPPPKSGWDRLWLSRATREALDLATQVAEADARLPLPLDGFMALLSGEAELEALAQAAPRVGAIAPLLGGALTELHGATGLRASLQGTTLLLRVSGIDPAAGARLVARGFDDVTPPDAAGARHFVAELARSGDDARISP